MADRRDKLVKQFVATRAATPTPDQQDRTRGAIGRGRDVRGEVRKYRKAQALQDRRPSSTQTGAPQGGRQR